MSRPEILAPAGNREMLEVWHRRSGVGQRVQNRFAKTAVMPVIFHDNESSGFARRFLQRRNIKRLDRVKV